VTSLVLAAAQYGLPPLAKSALAVFAIAAAGGIFLFVNYHMSDRLLPMPVVLLHGGLAATGFVLLLAAFSARQLPRSGIR
jgi:hypothetical protein